MVGLRNLDIAALRSFVLADSLGSFTAAARALNCSQAALSLRIKRLEEILGVTLFHRDYHRLTLTATGLRLLAPALKTLQVHDEILLSCQTYKSRETVRLGIAEDLARPFFRELIGRYAITNLELEIDITMLLSRDLVTTLEEGKIDLAIVSLPPGEDEGELLCRRPLHWVCAPDFTLDPLSPVPLAVHPEKCVFRTQALKILGSADKKHRIVFSSSGSSGVQAAVSAGMGLTIMSEDTIPPDLIHAPASWRLPELGSTDIRVLSVPGLSKEALAFKTALAETYGSGQPTV